MARVDAFDASPSFCVYLLITRKLHNIASFYSRLTLTMPYTTPTTRARCVLMVEHGYSTREIARSLARLGKTIHPTTVGRIYDKVAKKRHSLYYNSPKCGRHPLISPRSRRRAAYEIRSGRASTASQVKRQLFPDISRQTVSRALRMEGLKAYKKRKKFALTKEHAVARRKWAEERKDWTVEQFKRIVYSDESKFNLYGPDGNHWCWREPGQEFNPRHVAMQEKHGGGHVMVWGCMTRFGFGRLVRIEGKMNAEKYVAVLEEGLLPTLEDHFLSPSDIIFQQDNDRKHVSKRARAWFSEKGIELLPWPSKSPDMNIIEHPWDQLNDRVRARVPQPANLEQLWAALQEEWGKLGKDYLENLYESAPRRVQALIKARGWYTKY